MGKYHMAQLYTAVARTIHTSLASLGTVALSHLNGSDMTMV
jgi:hypothetical protein